MFLFICIYVDLRFSFLRKGFRGLRVEWRGLEGRRRENWQFSKIRLFEGSRAALWDQRQSIEHGGKPWMTRAPTAPEAYFRLWRPPKICVLPESGRGLNSGWAASEKSEINRKKSGVPENPGRRSFWAIAERRAGVRRAPTRISLCALNPAHNDLLPATTVPSLTAISH